MKRSTFNPDDETPLPPHGTPPDERRRPCMPCGKATLAATLSNYGGRCFECYQAYCRSPLPRLGEQIRRPMQRTALLDTEADSEP